MALDYSYSNNTRVNKNKAVRINQFEGTQFNLFYQKGFGAMLSNGTLAINIIKKGLLTGYDRKKNQDLINDETIVFFSSSSQASFNGQELKEMMDAIEKVKYLLETEDENATSVIPEKPKTIKSSDLVVGGIYEQADGRKYLYLGEAFYYDNKETRFKNHSLNRKNNWNKSLSKNLYVDIEDENEVVYDKENNVIEAVEGELDSYATKKKFVKCLRVIDLPKDGVNVKAISLGSDDYRVVFDGNNKFKSDCEIESESELN